MLEQFTKAKLEPIQRMIYFVFYLGLDMHINQESNEDSNKL